MRAFIIILFSFLLSDVSAQKPSSKQPDVLTVPSERDCKTMANNTLGVFADAVITKDFRAFHKFIAKKWSTSITVKQLREAFKDFIEHDIDMTIPLHTRPQFLEEPNIDSLGVLNFYLMYPTEPVKTVTKMRFLQEDKKWKLIGLNIWFD
jgi:hypothetical protein